MYLAEIKRLEIESARQQFLAECSDLSEAQLTFKATEDQWSITQIIEHMVWAERAGVIGMWKALARYRQGEIWQGEDANAGKSIEAVVDATWEEKELAPDIAKPRWGGPAEFWSASLNACSHTLQELVQALAKGDLEQIKYPHPISGPLSAVQRLDFLRFHLDRHRLQVVKLKDHTAFPRD